MFYEGMAFDLLYTYIDCTFIFFLQIHHLCEMSICEILINHVFPLTFLITLDICFTVIWGVCVCPLQVEKKLGMRRLS